MKKLLAILLCSLVTAAPAFAGEDSTDHWGYGGTGPSIFESPCGLADFKGEDAPMPEKCRPAQSYSPSERASSQADRTTQHADASAAAGATRSDAGFGAGSEAVEPAETLNDSFHYPSSD